MPRILVADDNTNIQKMVVLAFQDRGLEVITVGNGEAAVRRIPDADPDVVLADVFMPVRNGYEVCEFVKKDPRFCHIPVILLVGAFDPMDEKEARRVGADGVLKKPFVPPDPLIAMVMAALEKNPRVVAEMARAKEAALAAAALAAAKPEIPALAESKPLPEYPEPTPEEAAVIYGFGKGMRTLDSEDGEEGAQSSSAKVKEAPALKEPVKAGLKGSTAPILAGSAGDGDAAEGEFDESATANDWRRNAADFDVPENVAADPIYSYGRNFEPITFPSESKVPPRHVVVAEDDETRDSDRGDVKSEDIAARQDPAVVSTASDRPLSGAVSTSDGNGAAAGDASVTVDANAGDEAKGDDWEIECLPVSEAATDVSGTAKDQVQETKSSDSDFQAAPARFFTDSELKEAENSQPAAQSTETQHAAAPQLIARIEQEQQPAFVEPVARIEEVKQSSPPDTEVQPARDAEPGARVEEARKPRPSFVARTEESREKKDFPRASAVERTQQVRETRPPQRAEVPQPARTGFVARVRSWMDMMSPSRNEDTDDHWMTKLKAPTPQQETKVQSAAKVAAEHSEVEELAKRDAEILAFKRDPSTRKPALLAPAANGERGLQAPWSAVEISQGSSRESSAQKFEAAPVASNEAAVEVAPRLDESLQTAAREDLTQQSNAATPAVSASTNTEVQATSTASGEVKADAPDAELPVDSLAQVSSFDSEKEPVASGVRDFTSQLMSAPADAPHNGDFPGEQLPAEPLLLDEEHHEPSDYFSRPEEGRELETREEEIRAEEARVEAIPAEQPEPEIAQPFLPVAEADYWNREPEPDVHEEPFAANVPGPLFDSAFASSDGYDYDGRVPTLPPPNREALADIPFLMPPLPVSQTHGASSLATSGDTAIVDEVVRKVLERLQPGLRELLAESMKPLVENMLQEELHKKEK